MEQILSISLGWLASVLQTGRGKDLPKKAKYAIALLACLVAGTATHLLGMDGFDLNTLLANVGLAFAASQSHYNLFFKK